MNQVPDPVQIARGIPEETRGFDGLPAAKDLGEENFTKKVEDLSLIHI